MDYWRTILNAQSMFNGNRFKSCIKYANKITMVEQDILLHVCKNQKAIELQFCTDNKHKLLIDEDVHYSNKN